MPNTYPITGSPVSPVGAKVLTSDGYINLQPQNNSSTLLKKWALALAKTRDGVSDSRILCIGDSTTTGVMSTLAATYPSAGAYPTRLAALLNSSVTPSAQGLAVPRSILSGAQDNRWSVGAVWAMEQFGQGMGPVFGLHLLAET